MQCYNEHTKFWKGDLQKMKKVLAVLLAVFMLGGVLAVGASAAGSSDASLSALWYTANGVNVPVPGFSYAQTEYDILINVPPDVDFRDYIGSLGGIANNSNATVGLCYQVHYINGSEFKITKKLPVYAENNNRQDYTVNFTIKQYPNIVWWYDTLGTVGGICFALGIADLFLPIPFGLFIGGFGVLSLIVGFILTLIA